MMVELTTRELAALEVLKQTCVDVLEASLIAKAALKAGRGRIKRTMKIIELGDEELKVSEKTVSFGKAVEEALEVRKNRRERTKKDFKYFANKLMKECSDLANRRIRSLTTEDCKKYIQQTFCTPRQRNKARMIMSGVFSTAIKRGWCQENVVWRIEPEFVQEKKITILSREEIARLMRGARKFRDGSCLAATAIMLYTGVRPMEVERLRWKDVRLANKKILIAPQHSKTGGFRCVTICHQLDSILRQVKGDDEDLIVPPHWRTRWCQLHKFCGFYNWQQDVLRHTFATHHLAKYHDYNKLQVEMGHRSAELLRTRYIAMEGMVD